MPKSKYPKARIPDEMLDKMIVSGQKGFVPAGDERLSRATLTCRVAESDHEKLMNYLAQKKISKSQWTREVLTAAISQLE